MRRLILPAIIMLAFPLSTITAQESVAVMNYHKNSTVSIIHRVTGEYRPELANAIDIVLEKYPEIDRDEYLAVLMQESYFDTELIHHGDYGVGQIHLSFWDKKYGLDKENIMDVNVNCHVSADIIATWAMDKQGHINYGRYCGTKKNVKYYKKKLKIIKKLKEIRG